MLFKLTNAGDREELMEYAELIKANTIIDVIEKTELDRFGNSESNIYVDMASIEDTMIASESLGYRVIIGRTMFDNEPTMCVYDNYLE